MFTRDFGVFCFGIPWGRCPAPKASALPIAPHLDNIQLFFAEFVRLFFLNSRALPVVTKLLYQKAGDLSSPKILAVTFFIQFFARIFCFFHGKIISAHNIGRILTLSRFITMIIDRIALILTVIGALNWGSIGIFNFDIVAWICGGPMSVVSRIVYTIVALAGVWCISLIFRARESFDAIGES